MMLVLPAVVWVGGRAGATACWFYLSKGDHRADRFALVHEIERVVDLLQRHHVSDQVVDVDLAVHVPVDDLRHVGATPCAAERGALPNAAGHELERPGLDLLPGTGHSDN